MSRDYSEDHLIEQPAMDVFEALGWETANVYEGESFGEDGTIGRESDKDSLLRFRFINAIKKLNPNLPRQAYELAYEEINSNDSTNKLIDINYNKYQILKDGIPITFKNDKGEIIRNKKIKVFDFNNSENNNFIAVQQFWIEGKSKRRRRPDVIGFVNGILCFHRA